MQIKINGNKIQRFLADASLLLYLIAYFVYYQDVAGYGTMRLVATGFLLFMCIILNLKEIQRVCRIDYFIVGYSFFVLFGFFSILWAMNTKNVSSIMVTLVRIIVLLFFLNARVKTLKDAERVLFLFVFATMYRMLFVMQKMVDFYSLNLFFNYRFGDNFNYNSNENALLCLFSLLFLVYLIDSGHKKVPCILGIIFLSFIIIISGSKKGYFGLFAGMGLYFMLQSRGSKKIRRIASSILLVVLGLYLCSSVPVLYDLIGKRFESFFETLFSGGGEGSTGERMELIKQGLNIWLEHPLLGCGLNNFSVLQTVKVGYYAHNNYVELLADVGIVGTLMYYSAVCRPVFIPIYRGNKLAALMKSMALLLLVLEFGMVTYVTFEYIIIYYLAFLVLTKQITQNSEISVSDVAILRKDQI